MPTALATATFMSMITKTLQSAALNWCRGEHVANDASSVHPKCFSSFKATDMESLWFFVSSESI